MRSLPEIGPFLVPTIADLIFAAARRWFVGIGRLALAGSLLLLMIWYFGIREKTPRDSTIATSQENRAVSQGTSSSEPSGNEALNRLAGAIGSPLPATQVSPTADTAKTEVHRND
jgi:hypothetical protein